MFSAKKGIILILALVAMGCGQEKVLDIDSDFQSYITSFEDASREAGREIVVDNLIMEYGEPASATSIADCTLNGSDTPHVRVNRTKFNAITPSQREIVVFHELGHCVLGRGHTDEKNSEGVQLSLMASRLSGSHSLPWDEHRRYYVDELFQMVAGNPNQSIEELSSLSE